jgi:hypothetical protein
MPVSAHIEGELLIVRCVGEYSADDLIGTLDAALADPKLPARAHILLDVREAQSLLRRPTRELRRIASQWVIRAPRFDNRAALLVEGLARYGLMRMASTWVSFQGIDVHVFQDEQAAHTWLLRQKLPRTGTS